jgi:hypothetical protein
MEEVPIRLVVLAVEVQEVLAPQEVVAVQSAQVKQVQLPALPWFELGVAEVASETLLQVQLPTMEDLVVVAEAAL